MKVMGLFSIFDPIALFSNWLSLFSVLLFFSCPMLFLKKSKFYLMTISVMTAFKNEVSDLIGTKKNFFIIVTSLLMFIMVNNSLGIYSYVFTSTSHLLVTLGLALPLWLLSILISLVKNLYHFLEHLTPLSTPYLLMPFMVCIESVSLLIRPITLSVRLAANMVAGHLLLALLGGLIVHQDKSLVVFSALASFLLMLLESAVALIQAYVFSMLSVLYLKESF